MVIPTVTDLPTVTVTAAAFAAILTTGTFTYRAVTYPLPLFVFVVFISSHPSDVYPVTLTDVPLVSLSTMLEEASGLDLTFKCEPLLMPVTLDFTAELSGVTLAASAV
jgi:hypothetical protein